MGSSPKARQAKSKARIQRYQDLVDKQADRVPSSTQIVIPVVGERLGTNVVEFTGLSKSFGDKQLIRQSHLQAAARRHRRRHRPPTAPARPRCFA